MLLMDEEGTRIDASIKNFLSKFEGLLAEGGVYMLGNFGIADNDGRMKLTPHKYRITFFRHTHTVVKAMHTGFPLNRSIYSFADYIKILCKQVAENDATDLIIATKDGQSTKRVSFELQNHERRRLRCTLWSQLVEQFKSSMVNLDQAQHGIVIITCDGQSLERSASNY